MPTWAVLAVTIVISLASAFCFLMLRCRKTGNPFGRRARWWAVTIIVATAVVSTGIGLVVIAAGDHAIAAGVGLVLPSGLWLGKAVSQYGGRVPQGLVALVLFPLRGLDDAMAEDTQEWCDTRLTAASRTPQFLSEAEDYYFNQVKGSLKDNRTRNQLAQWQGSIRRKVRIVQMIDRGMSRSKVEEALRYDPDTADPRKYNADDPRALARRLRTEAENELNLFLSSLYRLGYHRLLIYPYRTDPGGRA